MKNSLEAKIDGVIRRLNRLYNKLSDDDQKYYGDDFKSIESSLKALEVLKKYMRIDVVDKFNGRKEEYGYISFNLMTQEEFDLLKKELEK